MRVARYFAVPEEVLQQFEEFNTQFKAHQAIGVLGQTEPYVVLKLVKEPKVKEVAPVA